MHSSLMIVGILTIGFTLASSFAYLMQRLHLPAILGYLIAGYIIGPYFPGFVANTDATNQLAEIGVILMLFAVGLHFKLEDLDHVKHIAIPGAIFQTAVATVVTILIAHWMGWSWVAGLILGLAIGVASTVVLVRVLYDNNVLNTKKGHLAIGWLVVEDIFTVLILIILPTLAAFSTGSLMSAWQNLVGLVLFAMGKFFFLALLMFTLGHRVIDYVLTAVARLRSQELFTLTIIAIVFLIAVGSAEVFGTSIALGAFIAGMVIGKTHVKHQAAANALPLKDVFTVIFFLSVGMLFNPVAIVEHFGMFISIFFVIVIVKPLAAFLIARRLGCSLNTALTVSIALAQIGEFSFILAEEAMNLKLVPDEGFDIIVACALISISINPLLFQCIGYFESTLQKLPPYRFQNKELAVAEGGIKETRHVIVIGFGPIGKAVSKILKESEYNPVIIEQNIDTVSREEDYTILFGDAADGSILKEARIEQASYLLVTIPDTEKMIKIVHAARHIHPKIQMIVRIQFVQEIHLLTGLDVKYVCNELEALNTFTSLTRQIFEPVRYF